MTRVPGAPRTRSKVTAVPSGPGSAVVRGRHGPHRGRESERAPAPGGSQEGLGSRRGGASAACSPGARGREARTRQDLPPRQMPGALDQAAPLRGWKVEQDFDRMRRLLEARVGSVRVTRVISPSCSMVAATRLAPPRREFCSVSVKISAKPAENSRVTLSMALSPTRARIVAELLPGSAVTAFCRGRQLGNSWLSIRE